MSLCRRISESPVYKTMISSWPRRERRRRKGANKDPIKDADGKRKRRRGDALFLSVSLFCFATWRHDKTTNKQPPQPKEEKFTCSISSCTSLKASRAASWEEKFFCLFIVEKGLFVCLFATVGMHYFLFVVSFVYEGLSFLPIIKKYICSRQTFPFLRKINI